MSRTPDIFLTPSELDLRANALADSVSAMPPGEAREQAIRSVQQDRRMAEMKRILGDPEERATPE